MKVLLTGAHGFIGKHCLTQLLKKGYEVHAVSTSTKQKKSTSNCEWHEADLLQGDHVKALLKNIRPTHMLHLAWYTEHGKYWNSTKNLAWVQASFSLMQEFANFGGERLVAAGTCAEYDWSHEICCEDITPCRPSTLYGAAKHSTHTILDAWAKQTSISLVWGRLFFLYGPGQSDFCLVPSIAKSLFYHEKALCVHGELLRDFMYVEDAAAAFVALLEKQVEGVVNIASGEATQLKGLVYTIGDLLGKGEFLKFEDIPAGEGEPKKLIANVARMKSEFGFEPQISIVNGLSSTLEYLKHTLRTK